MGVVSGPMKNLLEYEYISFIQRKLIKCRVDRTEIDKLHLSSMIEKHIASLDVAMYDETIVQEL